MITPDILPDLKRFGDSGGYRPKMLMLGAQGCTVPGYPRARDWFARWVGEDYTDLDLADGDLTLDLNADLRQLECRYETVANLGTLEHCWDVHRAWSNALRAVAPGGIFLTHSPVGGWADAHGLLDHGLHMTLKGAIEEFVTLNGFEIQESWVTKFRNRGRILWLRAEKKVHIPSLDAFRPVLQVRGLSPTYRSHP